MSSFNNRQEIQEIEKELQALDERILKNPLHQSRKEARENLWRKYQELHANQGNVCMCGAIS